MPKHENMKILVLLVLLALFCGVESELQELTDAMIKELQCSNSSFEAQHSTCLKMLNSFKLKFKNVTKENKHIVMCSNINKQVDIARCMLTALKMCKKGNETAIPTPEKEKASWDHFCKNQPSATDARCVLDGSSDCRNRALAAFASVKKIDSSHMCKYLIDDIVCYSKVACNNKAIFEEFYLSRLPDHCMMNASHGRFDNSSRLLQLALIGVTMFLFF